MPRLKHALLALLALPLTLAFAGSVGADELKLAVGQRGAWDTAIPELGLRAGLFKKHGIELNILYTQGGAETQQAVLSRSVDIGVAAGTLGTLGVAAKGAPLRIIGGEATGVGEFYWYVSIASPIKTVDDMTGHTVGFSTNGSSSHTALLLLAKQHNITVKPVASGGLAATLTQLMSGQIDIGWAAAPFGLDQVDNTIRIVARGSDVAAMRQLTTRVLIAHAETLAQKKAIIANFLAAYRETIDWMYAAPEAIKLFAEFAGISESATKRARDEFFTKAALDPGTVTGLPEMMGDAVQFKFLQAPLTQDQLAQIVQIGRNAP
jgi:NitT/TauT family transport system substrate-binding protein